MRCSASCWNRCLNCVIKILATLGSLACYLLLFGFWKSFETRYHRFILITILPGYSAVYIAFTLGVLCGEEMDRGLNLLCSMFGVGAYLGAAAACWLHLYLEKKKIGEVYGLAAIAAAAFQAAILTIDFLFLLKDVQPKIAANLDTDREMTTPDSSFPSVTGVPRVSTEGPPNPKQPGNFKQTK